MTNEISEDNPIQETFEVRVLREFNNLSHVYHHIDRRLEEIARQVEENTRKLSELEESVSFFAYIPTRSIYLRYDHMKQDLYFQTNLSMHFEKNEADVLSVMFKKKTGRPLKKKFLCAEVAEKFKKERRDIQTPNAIFQTIKRIQNKIDKKHRLGSIFTVTTKEFYFTDRINLKEL